MKYISSILFGLFFFSFPSTEEHGGLFFVLAMASTGETCREKVYVANGRMQRNAGLILPGLRRKEAQAERI